MYSTIAGFIFSLSGMFIDTIIEHINSFLEIGLRELQQKCEVDMQNTLNSFIMAQNVLLKDL